MLWLFLRHEALEWAIVGGVGLGADADKGDQTLIARRRIDLRAVATDDPRTFQALYALVDRGPLSPTALPSAA